ncbi:acylneuraminate cytidylyltransferase family protein [Chloroflexota bacterium]
MKTNLDPVNIKGRAIKPPDCHIVAIIGARGGSKGLPKKNIRLLSGKPLIAWTIEAAKNCELVDRVLVSTDDDEIAKVARKYGAEVPFKRPSELAGDDVPSISYLQHAVEWLESQDNYRVDIVLYLQVTDVFRKKYLVEKVISRLLKDPRLDSVFVGYLTHKNFWKRKDGRYQRLTLPEEKVRQQKEAVFREDIGLACASRVHVIKGGRRIGDCVDIVPNPDFCTSIDIHNEFDLWLAERILSEGQATIND